jgi:hypothetical protein
MAQDTSSEINSKLVEYFIEVLFNENAAIDRIQSRKEEYSTFHVGVDSTFRGGVESKTTRRSMSYTWRGYTPKLWNAAKRYSSRKRIQRKTE